MEYSIINVLLQMKCMNWVKMKKENFFHDLEEEFFMFCASIRWLNWYNKNVIAVEEEYDEYTLQYVMIMRNQLNKLRTK